MKSQPKKKKRKKHFLLVMLGNISHHMSIYVGLINRHMVCFWLRCVFESYLKTVQPQGLDDWWNRMAQMETKSRESTEQERWPCRSTRCRANIGHWKPYQSQDQKIEKSKGDDFQESVSVLVQPGKQNISRTHGSSSAAINWTLVETEVMSVATAATGNALLWQGSSA